MRKSISKTTKREEFLAEVRQAGAFAYRNGEAEARELPMLMAETQIALGELNISRNDNEAFAHFMMGGFHETKRGTRNEAIWRASWKICQMRAFPSRQNAETVAHATIQLGSFLKIKEQSIFEGVILNLPFLSDNRKFVHINNLRISAEEGLAKRARVAMRGFDCEA